MPGAVLGISRGDMNETQPLGHRETRCPIPLICSALNGSPARQTGEGLWGLEDEMGAVVLGGRERTESIPGRRPSLSMAGT